MQDFGESAAKISTRLLFAQSLAQYNRGSPSISKLFTKILHEPKPAGVDTANIFLRMQLPFQTLNSTLVVSFRFL